MIFVRRRRRPTASTSTPTSAAPRTTSASSASTRYAHIESRTNTWTMNWKLVLDTFTECYHIRDPAPDSARPDVQLRLHHLRGLRAQLRLDRSAQGRPRRAGQAPRASGRCSPTARSSTSSCPNALLVHQIDHIELWRIEPVDVRTSRLTTSIFAPTEPATEKARNYWIKNLDLLLQVTGTEDFPLMEQIQANLDSGALPEVVYGRNEPPLIHFHRAVNAALAG